MLATTRLRHRLKTFLADQVAGIAAQISAHVGKVAKAGVDDEALQEARAKRVQEILDGLDFTAWQELIPSVQSVLEIVAKDGAREGLVQLDAIFIGDTLDLANEGAIDYAKDRAAEMVGMKYVDDELVENPNADWQITDATREMLRDDVTQAMEEGWSNDTLADHLSDNYAFSDERSETIARTETARADVAGNIEGWKSSGVVEQKQWLADPDCCDECQDIDGEVVDLDDDFSSGDDGPPAHPNCRCAVLPVLNEDDEGNDE